MQIRKTNREKGYFKTARLNCTIEYRNVKTAYLNIKIQNSILTEITLHCHVFSIKTLGINHAQIRNLFPNMVFPPVLREKMTSFRACACKHYSTLSFPAWTPGPFSGRGKRESRNRTIRYCASKSVPAVEDTIYI